MRLLAITLLLSLPVYAATPTEEEVKQAQQICQYKAMIASTTQQARQDYKAEFDIYQSWETFLHYVAEEMNLKNDEGLKSALEISKHVFFDYATETDPNDILGVEFDKCWHEFVESQDEVSA